MEHDENTLGQLIISVRPNVQQNKHSVRQKTITYVDLLNIKNQLKKYKKPFSYKTFHWMKETQQTNVLANNSYSNDKSTT